MAKINVKNYGILHPYVIYHDDMDGHAAAWLLHSHFETVRITDSPSDYQSYDYDGMKLGSVNDHTVLYLVDVSFTPATMYLLVEACEKAKYVIWIDHHASSLDLLEKFYNKLKSLNNLFIFVNNGACGALLTYIYLTKYIKKCCPLEDNKANKDTDIDNKYINFLNPQLVSISIEPSYEDTLAFCEIKDIQDESGYGLTVPYWLDLVDDHDRYQKRNTETRSFILGTKLDGISLFYKTENKKICFNDSFWDYLDMSIDEYIRNGNIIQNYQRVKANEERAICFMWTEPDTGTKILCKNIDCDSYGFGDMFNKVDAVCSFHYTGEKWKYTFYSNPKSEFNCKTFCEKYGGGGHVHASGMSTDKLILV